MKAKLIIDNREIEVEISEEQLSKLEVKTARHTGYERVRKGDQYYVARESNIICAETECNDSCDNGRYDAANYYSSLAVAENNLRADILMRRLRRFAIEHRKEKLDWRNDNQEKYFICWEHDYRQLSPEYSYEIQDVGIVYFDSEKTAEMAIEKFRDELTWYFTEYKDCAGE